MQSILVVALALEGTLHWVLKLGRTVADGIFSIELLIFLGLVMA